MSDFPSTHTTKLTKRLTLYIPEHDRFGNRIQRLEYWLAHAITVLTTISASGASRLHGEGAWVITGTGELQREPVNILYTNVEPAAFNEKRKLLIDLMEDFGTATGQDAVAAEYDGEMHFITIKYEAVEQKGTPSSE